MAVAFKFPVWRPPGKSNRSINQHFPVKGPFFVKSLAKKVLRTSGLSLASGKQTRRSLKATCLDSKLKNVLKAIQAQDIDHLASESSASAWGNQSYEVKCRVQHQSLRLSVSQSPQKGHGEINADQPATKRGCALVCTSVHGLWRAQ